MKAILETTGGGATLLAAAVIALIASPALAARPDAPAPGTYPLKDGTTLVVAPNGWMRMFAAGGKPVYMKDGVAMETRAGALIVMKEDPNWRQLRQFGTVSPRSR